jgi:hypothetical protein
VGTYFTVQAGILGWSYSKIYLGKVCKMNDRLKELVDKTNDLMDKNYPSWWEAPSFYQSIWQEKFVEMIVREMCGLMEQAEDDYYHCFEPSERPTEYIEWLLQWRTRFEKHFGVKE